MIIVPIEVSKEYNYENQQLNQMSKKMKLN